MKPKYHNSKEVHLTEADRQAMGYALDNVKIVEVNNYTDDRPTGNEYKSGAAGSDPVLVADAQTVQQATTGTVTPQSLTGSGSIALTQSAHSGKPWHAEPGQTALTIAAAGWPNGGGGEISLINHTGGNLPIQVGAGMTGYDNAKGGQSVVGNATPVTLVTLAYLERAVIQVKDGAFVNVAVVGGGPSEEGWTANTYYRQGAIVRAPSAQGTIGAGDRIIRSTASTSRAAFDATEAALWSEVAEDPDVVKYADVVNNLTSTSATQPLSAAQGKALQDGKRDLHTVGHPYATAATTYGHIVTASSQHSAPFHGWKAFQETPSSTSEWATAASATATLTLELPQPVIFNRVLLKGRGNGTEYPTRWKIEGSGDGTTYTTLLDKTAADESLATEKTFDFTNSTPYRFYRFNMTASAGTNPGLNKIRYYHQGIDILPTLADIGGAAVATSGTPAMDGTAALGTATTAAHSDHVHPADTSKAALASPTFTGTPVAPTAAADVNTTQIATTAFVVGQAGTVAPVVDGTAAVGTSLRYARADHVHPSDTTREVTSNKVTAFSTPTDTQYPSAKLVSDQLALKAANANMTGSTAGAAGAAGLVPSPAAGQQVQFLRGDATWASPPPQAVQSNTYGTAGDTQAAQTTVAVTDAVQQPTVNAIGASAVVVTSSAFISNIGRSHGASRWRINGTLDAESATDLTSRAIAATFEGSAEVLYRDDYPSTPFYSRVSAPQYRGILDRMGAAANIAYSMRRVRSAYTGPCLRLRRSSDSAERDLRFGLNGRVDLTETYTVGSTTPLGQTAAVFVGSGNGLVVTWYDQSGNVRHANTTGTQFTKFPMLYRAGVLQTLNSLPCVSFLTDEGLQTPDSGLGVLTATANHHSILSRQQMLGTTAANRRRSIVSGITAGLNRLYFNWSTHISAGTAFVVYLDGNPNDLVGDTTDVAAHNLGWTHTNTSGIGYVDGTSAQTYANPSTVAPADFHLNGAYPPSTAESSNVNHSELLILSSAISATLMSTWSTSATAAL